MRDSKNILHAKLGVSPMERQYGGGLDAAYMNRRRSSAFAAPDATSAFASPMSQGGLPTIYREQGGPLPITSVYGQGIPRIIYRENGGDLDFGLSAEDMAAAYEEAGIDTSGFAGPGMTSAESDAGAGQYVPPQRGDPAQGNEPLGYINPPPTPFRSTNPNYLTYEAQQKINRETQGPPPEAAFGAGVPGFRTSYPSQDIINADINSMKRAAQNKLNEERKEKANKPDQTSATSLYLYNVAQHGKTFGATNLPPSALYKAAETPTGVMNLLAAIARGDYGTRAKSLEVPQELINTANQERANQSYGIAPPQEFNRKTGGGLPTIYRDVGGGVGDDYAAAAGEYADMVSDAMAGDYTGADFGDEDGSYQKQMEAAMNVPSAPTSDGGADIPDYAFGLTDDRKIDLFGPKGRANPRDALGESSRSVLLSTLRNMTGNWPDAERALDNMTTQQILDFDASTRGSSLFGDLKADDFSKGYRFGGPEGTLQDILEKGAADQFDLSDIISKDKKEKEFDKFVEETYGDKEVSKGFMDRIGLGGLYDTLTDMFSIQAEVSPTTLENIAQQLEGTGAQFTPVNSFLAGAMDFALPAAFKGLANLTGGGKTIGTITTADGMSFNLSDAGKLSMNMPMSEYDEGSGATPVKRTVKKKKETKEEKEETPKTGMAALLARRPEPKKRLDTLAGSQDIYKSIYNRPFRTVQDR